MHVKTRKTRLVLLLFVASLLFVLPFHMVKAQTTTVSVSPQTNIVSVGQTLTVNIEISNVQNLYAVDIALTWDTSMLKLTSNQSFVGVANGILNTPVTVVQDTADQSTGEYHLVATSENPAGPFSGSATVATLTFTVTSAGQSQLTFLNPDQQLASYPQSGQTSQYITATVVNGSVSTSSNTTTPSSSPTASASSSPSKSPSSSPTATPKIPEFPSLAVLSLLVLIPLVLLVSKFRKQIFRNISRTQGFAQ